MQLSLKNNIDDITLLNRLTLNSDGLADEKLFLNILEDCNGLFIFRKLIKNITNIKAEHIQRPEFNSDKIVFKLKFDDVKSAKDAEMLIIENEYMIAKRHCTVNVEQNNNKLKLIIL